VKRLLERNQDTKQAKSSKAFEPSAIGHMALVEKKVDDDDNWRRTMREEILLLG
jgi:hypothetical protein